MEAKTEKNSIADEKIPVQISSNRKLYNAMGVSCYEHSNNVNLNSKTELENAKEMESDKGNIEYGELQTKMYKGRMGSQISFTKASVPPPLDKNDAKDTKRQKTRTDKKEKEQNEVETSPPCTFDEHFEFKVAILHTLHPKEILNSQQLKKIRSLLLKELDQTDDKCVHLNFVASTVGEGWFTLTCHNAQTTDWLVTRAKKIQPQLDIDIKIIPVNDRYMSIVYLPAEDAMPEEVFLTRLTKQNSGLSTDDWRVLSMFEVANGRQCITLSIDEISKEIIQSQNGKLFLNFSQIDVFIEKSVQFTGKQQNGLEQASLIEFFLPNYSSSETESTAPSVSKVAHKSEEKTAPKFDTYTIRNDVGTKIMDSNLSTTDTTGVAENNKTPQTNIKPVKSPTVGRSTLVYPSKMLSTIRTSFDGTGVKGIVAPPQKKIVRRHSGRDGR